MPIDESEKEIDRDSKAFWEGYEDGFNDLRGDCPYPYGSEESKQWHAGVEEGTWSSA